MTNDGQQAPRIAVIIPCYNHANVLRRTIEALFHQTLPPAEIVVVDDASSDDPKKIIDEINKSRSTDIVQFVRFDQNRGAPAARNEGARRTISPYVIFLDADAALIPSALETYVRTLEVHPEASFAYSNLYWGTKPFPSKPFNVEALRRRNYIHTSSLIRREHFPGFDESLKKFQDWDLWLTMTEQGRQGIWVNEFLYEVEPRKEGGISKWIPSYLHRIPWPIFGWMPKEIKRFRDAEKIIKTKHHLV